MKNERVNLVKFDENGYILGVKSVCLAQRKQDP